MCSNMRKREIKSAKTRKLKKNEIILDISIIWIYYVLDIK